jgi:glycosyltransferase involved in cell wall biosynthesis
VFYMPELGRLLDRTSVTGGAETQVSLIAKRLAGLGHDICICTYVDGDPADRVVDGVEVITARRPMRGGLVSNVKEVVVLARLLHRARPDVIVTRVASFEVGVVGLIARLTGRRFVYSSANVSDFSYSSIVRSLRDRTLYALGLRLANAIVVQTEEQLELCHGRLVAEPTMIRGLVEPANPRTGAGEAFLWAGRVVWYKRPLDFVELARALPEARFWMVAVPTPETGDLLEELREAASDVPNLELMEPVPRDELLALASRAVATVNTADFEGMSNVTLEGWARGVPALALSHDPDGLIAQHGLGVFADGSRPALVEAARQYWSNRHDLEEVGDRCRSFVDEAYNPERNAQQWAGVISASRASFDVGFYVPSIGPQLRGEAVGGAETQILELAKGLASRGAKVAIAAYDERRAREFDLDGVTICPRPPHAGGSGLYSALREARLTRRSVRGLNASVIVTRIAGPHVGLAGLVARASGSRFVFSSANVSDFAFADIAPRLRDRLLYRLGVAMASDVVVQTDEQRVLCRRTFRRDAPVIRSFTAPPTRPTRVAEAFLWAGRTAWYKRPLEYVRLAAALPHATFWMAALPTNPHEDVWTDVAREAAGVPNLVVLPPMPRSDLLQRLPRAVAVVNTSSFEGMSNVILEGWSCGVPALALEHDPDGLIATKGLGRFAAGSWESFVTAATELWDARGENADVAERCRAYIGAQHDSARIVDAWEGLLLSDRRTVEAAAVAAEVA